ncbi:hypothetical protein LCGC14_0797240 [marine sediment metagenome]|uniref:DUF4389 domain-containing protein n=1 Tax=marine sediment metagenome TaxID=412755 RepID=A0A0F9QAJ4_9ZZZZ
MENETLKNNVSDKNQWMRILYMILFAIILYFTMMIVGLVVFVQLIFALVTGKPNSGVADFASDLTDYVHRIVGFLTYTHDKRPFPFNPWDEKAIDDLSNHD